MAPTCNFFMLSLLWLGRGSTPKSSPGYRENGDAAPTAPHCCRFRPCSGGPHSGVEPMALDRVFIPRDSAAGPIGNDEMAGFELERLGQDGIRPVLPLEPVRRLGDPHEMRRDFRIEVGRHLD